MSKKKMYVSLNIDGELYSKYRRYLEETFGIYTAGHTARIRPISEELFEEIICYTLLGKNDEIIKTVLNKGVNK